MATKAGGRHGARRGVAAASEIPVDMADKWELITKLVGENLYDMRQNIRKAVGARPYKGFVNDQNELAKRWAEIADDPAAIAELLSSEAKYTVDGRVLVPKELLAMMAEQHRRRREGGLD